MGSPNEDPFEIIDQRFRRYTIPIVWLEQLHTGMRWAEVRSGSPTCAA